MASQEYEDAIDHKDDAVSCLKNAQRNLSSIVSKSNVFFEEFSDDIKRNPWKLLVKGREKK